MNRDIPGLMYPSMEGENSGWAFLLLGQLSISQELGTTDAVCPFDMLGERFMAKLWTYG